MNELTSRPSPSNIVDIFADQLQGLSPGQRAAVVQHIADVYYEFNRTITEAEIANIIRFLPSVTGRRQRLGPRNRPSPSCDMAACDEPQATVD